MYTIVPTAEPGSVSSASIIRVGVRGGSAGQAEVEHLGVTAFGEKDVCGLDIAMSDALGVRFLQGVGNLDRVLERLVERDGAGLQPIRERLALQVLHDEVRDAVLFTDVIERANVGMIELGDRARLALEPLAEIAGRRRVGRGGP